MPIPVRNLYPLTDAGQRNHGALIRLSTGYSPDGGRLHTRYSPVRRSPPKYCYFYAAPRLACVKPVASVHPEPGSNSPLYVCLTHSKLTSLWFIFFTWLLYCISKISFSFTPQKTFLSSCVSDLRVQKY